MKDYWLNDHIPEVRAVEASRFRPIDRIATALGGNIEVKSVGNSAQLPGRLQRGK
jgi:hypothetical protein